MAQCIRPNCNKEIDFFKPFGVVTLGLERVIDEELAVNVEGKTCSTCTSDLADFWLLGKR
jgi:hypothetical protein